MIHKYTYASGKLLRETVASGAKLETLDFSYDESGAPYSLRYTNGAGSTWSYHYLVNLQGDVIGLLNSTGDVVARYVYDAWGRPLSVTDGKGRDVTGDPSHIANRNPLRYRGYYYDQETGFYYLQSRYYDPVLCRFVNADSFASTGQSFLGYNMFLYCKNNPINNIDILGHICMAIDRKLQLTDSGTSCGGGVGFLAAIALVVAAVVNSLTPPPPSAPAKKGPQYPDVESIDWNGVDEIHVLHGTKGGHEEG